MTKPLPIVRQLQAEAIDPDVPVSKLLRLAKAIATKLGREEALNWIDRELDGYNNQGCLLREVPAYRTVFGTPMFLNPYRGWKAIHFKNPQDARYFAKMPLAQSMEVLEQEASRTEMSMFRFPPEMQAKLTKGIGEDLEVAIFLEPSQVRGAIAAVRNLVLNWGLELEKAGILGEGMTFTAQEKGEATVVTQQFFQNVGVLGNVSDNAKVTNTQTATASIDIGEVGRFAQEALGSIGQLPPELRPKLGPVLNQLRTEAAKEEPNPSTLRELLASARTIAEGAASNLAASGIVAMIGRILGA